MKIRKQEEEGFSIKYKSIKVIGTKIFYREAGDSSKPKLLLLHGYPASSHMFRNVIPRLSEQFHIIAPDLPGFGFSDVPSRDNFEYTFENFSRIIAGFLSELNINKTSFYLFDYGVPILMRLITANPSCVDMLIFQNGTIHFEGLGIGLKNAAALFKNKTTENLEKLAKLVEPEYIQWEYLNGVRDLSRIAPESYTIDQLLMDRKELKEIHLEIKENYAANFLLYEKWQEVLMQLQPPALIVWGEHDEVFTKQGALALHSDIKNSKLIFYPSGHFVLEEFGTEIAEEIVCFYQSIFKK